MIERAIAGLALAAIVALLANRAGSLSPSGAVAAAIIGTASVTAGWGWGALLVTYFVASVALSRVGSATKAARVEAIVEKGGRRDAAQVMANGGVFALLALSSLVAPAPWWPAVAACASLGALAAATADTWATEVGTLAGGVPRSILTMYPVPAGTSGGVSAPGTLASCAGALFVAAIARTLGLSPALLAVTLGGIAGAMADTVLGATVQERRRCSACGRDTERRIHGCGARTTVSGGIAGIDNDAVNLGATIAGAAVAGVVLVLQRRFA
jgi:uncharacterized protein (TIGR00297 family)